MSADDLIRYLTSRPQAVLTMRDVAALHGVSEDAVRRAAEEVAGLWPGMPRADKTAVRVAALRLLTGRAPARFA